MKKGILVAVFMAITLMMSGCAQLNKAITDAKNYIDHAKEYINKELTYKANPKAQGVNSDKDILLILLDGSGSMNERDRSKKVKIEAARETLKDILNKVDTSKVNVALMVFKSGCKSTKLVVPPTNDIDRIIYEAYRLRPFGSTPLAYSIRKIGDFIRQYNRPVKVILITDGIETCGGDPALEARRLKQMYGVDVELYVIGYGVDEKARRQLMRIASAANGEYVDAKNAEALNRSITTISQKLDIVSENWKGDTFKFNINFDTDSYTIKPQYMDQVRSLATYLKKTGYGAEIQGHTDSVGDAKYNQKLSEKRAQAVAKALVDLGVDPQKIYAVGYGEYAPVASNDTPKGRFLNRRVEAHIIKDGKLDISHINEVNFKKKTDVSKASAYSFVGYYKVLDTKRPMDQYYAVLVFYANGKGKHQEFVRNRALHKEPLSFMWRYDRDSKTLTMDFMGEGKFAAKLEGNTNDFYAKGRWANGKEGKIHIVRISKEEFDCLFSGGRFEGQSCVY